MQVLTDPAGRLIWTSPVLPGARHDTVRTDALINGTTADLRADTVARTPLDRLGEPGDIADVVALLASDAGRWVTGPEHPTGGGAF